MHCEVCGSPLPPEARFCPTCGAAVAATLATEERRLVTIVFADIVDSTGLAQRLDPERTRELLGRFYDVAVEELQALRGRPEKFIGDAVMAVFGLPRTHEDDAIRAVRAGLAIRARARRLASEMSLDEGVDVRVGIETGETATGVGPAGQLLVTGPAVNAAARLQAAAGPGQVLVGAATRSLVEGAVALGERREVEAKGFQGGLAAYAVEGLTTRSVRRTIPLVGRVEELALLQDCFARVARGGEPLLCTLLGEAGIGKSRLVDEFQARLPEGVRTFVGRSPSHADSTTFAPITAMIRSAAEIEDDDDPATVRARLEKVLPGDDRAVDGLALAMGLSDRAYEESAFVQGVQDGFLALIERLAADGPIVLVVEDGHAVTPAVLDLVERIVARPGRDARVLLVVPARTELLDERPTWGLSSVNCVTLRLEPLSEGEAVRLVRHAAGGRVSDPDDLAIARRAGGNPYFIIETTGMLLDGDRDPSRSLPPSVQAVVAARLDALPEATRELARRAAVFLYSFDEKELAFVAQCDDESLRALEESEIIVREDGTPRWRFRHATLRDVAYGSLPKRERMRLHAAVADGLIDAGHPTWAAVHLELAALASVDVQPGDRELPDRAVEALAASADRARRRMESREAAGRSERALALAGPERGWGVREARILAGLGESRYWLGEYEPARAAVQRALAIAEPAHDVETLARALGLLGDITINVDADVDAAEAIHERALAAAEELGDPRTLARTLLFAGWAPWTRHDYDEAEVLWRRAFALAIENDDRWALVRALTALSINASDRDDLDEAGELIGRAITLAEQIGDRFSVAVTTVQCGRVYEDLGEYEQAIENFDRAEEIFTDLGARWELADAVAERGIAQRELGRLDEAERDLERAIAISEELGERQLQGWTWRALARVSERRGDAAATEERLRRAKEAEARRPR